MIENLDAVLRELNRNRLAKQERERTQKVIKKVEEVKVETNESLKVVDEKIVVLDEKVNVVDAKAQEAIDIAKNTAKQEGKPGKDGKDGKDGVNGKDGKSIKGEPGKDGYTPRKGIDYFDGKDGKDGKSIKGKDGQDGSPDTPEEIRDKLSTLKRDARLDAKHIKNLDKALQVTFNTAVIENDPVWNREKICYVLKVDKNKKKVIIKSTNYAIGDLDEVIVFTSTATATLPATTANGVTYRIVCRSGTLTITGTGGDTIKGEVNQVLYAGEDLILTDTEAGIWE